MIKIRNKEKVHEHFTSGNIVCNWILGEMQLLFLVTMAAVMTVIHAKVPFPDLSSQTKDHLLTLYLIF